MNSSIFRSYDIRGIYPDEINISSVEKIAEICGRMFGGGRIIVAHDVRNGSVPLAAAVQRGLDRASQKLHKKIAVEMVGFSTTPMFVYLVHELKAAGGIMVTASHNPKEYNGLKIVGKNGIPISGSDLKKHI